MAKRRPDTLMAFVATFLGIIGFFIALILRRDDKYVMFYAKQSLVLFVISLFISLFSAVPVIGWIFSVFGGIFFFVLWIFLWIYALSEEEKEIPVLGELARKINL